MACQIDPETVSKKDNNSDEFVVCELCTDEIKIQEASNHCDHCLINFCDRCAETHGKGMSEGETACHRIEKGVLHYDMELELCPVDGQKMSLYCPTCRVRVCPECELVLKKHGTHVMTSLTRLMGLEKEKLLDKLDDVTTKTETISYVPDHVKSIRNQIELKWLARKELIRQEFASLFETLTAQQNKLLADMEKEVEESLERLNQLQQDHDSVMSNTCKLSDDCIFAVQNLPRDRFLSRYPHFMESVKQLEHQVERMQSAEDQMPVFLKVPFSLYQVKRHLHKSLQLSTFNLKGIRAKEHQRFVPYSRLQEMLSVNMLLDTTSNTHLPPSSTLHYSVDIYSGFKNSKNPLWSSKNPVHGMDLIINGGRDRMNSIYLLPGCLYMVKIRPILTCKTHQGKLTAEGRVISVAIITDTAVPTAIVPERAMTAGDNLVAISNKHGLLNATIESRGVENLPCINTATAEKSNKNDNRKGRTLKYKGRTLTSFRPRMRPSAMDTFVSPPALHSKGGGAPFADGQFIRNRACYKPSVPTASSDVAFPVPVGEAYEGRLCTQWRYASDLCSFEEARLVEDNNLQVSHIAFFGH